MAVDRLLMVMHDCLEAVAGDASGELREALRSVQAAPSRRPPATVPGCAALPAALAGADQQVRNAVAGAAAHLAWRVPGYGRLPAALADRMAVVELVGPCGMLDHDNVSLGIILLAPGLDYPSHRHAAEEVYLILSGVLHWHLDGRPLGLVGKGQSVRHYPWQPHAMSTGEDPALAFWGWTGDIRGETYAMPP